MPVKVVESEDFPNRKAMQDSSRYHNGAESDRVERGSECCWLSQRGSNWMQTQFAKIWGNVREGRLQMGQGMVE